MPTAIYRRVSSKDQTTASQGSDLDAYRDRLKTDGEEFLEFEETFTGKVLKRPEWDKLWALVVGRKIQKIVVWRLDRLGRTCGGLAALFKELNERKIGLVSLRDGPDLATPAGRLMAHVLASVAEYELEVKNERQAAGIAAAKRDVKEGKREKYGSGRKPGLTIPNATCELVRRLKNEGKSITEIATVTKLSRPTIYRVIKEDNQA
jgi:DNA invertase Pin-like site-specific DNA recombinase